MQEVDVDDYVGDHDEHLQRLKARSRPFNTSELELELTSATFLPEQQEDEEKEDSSSIDHERLRTWELNRSTKMKERAQASGKMPAMPPSAPPASAPGGTASADSPWVTKTTTPSGKTYSKMAGDRRRSLTVETSDKLRMQKYAIQISMESTTESALASFATPLIKVTCHPAGSRRTDLYPIILENFVCISDHRTTACISDHRTTFPAYELIGTRKQTCTVTLGIVLAAVASVLNVRAVGG
jgi:hypothetical protein